MKRRGRFHADGAVDLSPPAPLDPEAFAAEARRLADEAAHGAELAALLALARQPLDPDAPSATPANGSADLADARQGELDVALVAAAGAIEATYDRLRARPGRALSPRAIVVDPGEQVVLSASGEYLPGAWPAVRRRLGAERARDRARHALTASAARREAADRTASRRRRFVQAVRIGSARGLDPDKLARFILRGMRGEA